MGQLLSLPMLARRPHPPRPLGPPRVTPLAARPPHPHRGRRPAPPRRLHGPLPLPLLRHPRPPGRAGDFITAPEISQMFGELIGLWVAQVWADQGRPDPFVLAELGPGRGTLMRDALRAAAARPRFPRRRPPLARRDQPRAPRRARPRRSLTRRPHGSRAPVSCRPGLSSSSPTSSSTPCPSASSSAPTSSGASVTSASTGPPRFCWSAARADAALDARFPHLPDGAIAEVSPAAEALAAELGARIAARWRRGAPHRLRRLGRPRRHPAGGGRPRSRRPARRHRARPTSPPTSASAPSPRPPARPARFGTVTQGRSSSASASPPARGRWPATAPPSRTGGDRRRASPLDPPGRNGTPLPGAGARA